MRRYLKKGEAEKRASIELIARRCSRARPSSDTARETREAAKRGKEGERERKRGRERNNRRPSLSRVLSAMYAMKRKILAVTGDVTLAECHTHSHVHAHAFKFIRENGTGE